MAIAKGVSLAFMAVFSCCVVQGAGGVTIEFLNECPFNVWPAATQMHGHKMLGTGQSWKIPLTAGSTDSRFWGCTGCTFPMSCTTGVCENVQNITPPVTMVEYSVNEAENVDFYKISLIGGFNIPISFKPSNSKCQAIACSSNITANCPAELKVSGACMSACTVYNTSQYCCNGHYSGNNCRPTNYSRFFKTQCPQAYSSPSDDSSSSTFSCAAGTNYTVIFCGDATSSTSTPPSAAPSGAGDMTIEILNECEFPVWPAGGIQTFEYFMRLDRGESWTVPLTAGPTVVKIWGRTGCFVCTTAECWGVMSCETGLCKGVPNCEGLTPPASMVEYYQASNLDHYLISLVGGFNLPISFIPSNSECQATACRSNITANCPSELRADGGCMSACTIFNTSQYCCTGDYDGNNCRPTNYSGFFKTQCPQAYSYLYDDDSMLTCPTGTKYYTVVFCGAVASTPYPAASLPSPAGSGPDSSASTPSPTASFPSGVASVADSSGMESH